MCLMHDVRFVMDVDAVVVAVEWYVEETSSPALQFAVGKSHSSSSLVMVVEETNSSPAQTRAG